MHVILEINFKTNIKVEIGSMDNLYLHRLTLGIINSKECVYERESVPLGPNTWTL